MKLAHDVFISYSSKDKASAAAVCRALEGDGIRCWIAPRDVTAGLKYAEAIVEAINGCRVFLLLLSSASNNSRQVEREVDRAASKEIPMLSFRLEPVELSKTMEYYLSSLHWLDASQPPREEELQVLIEAVQNLLTPAGEPGATKPQVRVKITTPSPEQPVQLPGERTDIPPQAVESTGDANPFTFGNPIKDPARFHGRQAEIRQIVNRLLSSAHESTSIIGERRMGKTSLLYHLSHPQVSAQLGLTPDKFCLVYLDFQGLTDITPTRFWQRVLKKMSRAVCDASLVPIIEKLGALDSFDLFDLEDLFEATHQRGLTVVMMMDEFEYVTQNPNFGSDFFGGLRALAIHHGVALLPATRRELADLCYSDEIKGSPFFNIFANVVLRPFSKGEVDGLLAGYTAPGGFEFSSAEKDFIWSLGGGYPFFLQAAGHYLYEGKIQQKSGDALQDYAARHFTQQAEGHYTFLWSNCTDSEKITLLTMLGLSLDQTAGQTLPSLENLAHLRTRAPQDLSALAKRGLVSEDEVLYHIFSFSFADWMRREISAATGEEESQPGAAEWLKENGGKGSDAPVLVRFKKQYWNMLNNINKEISIGGLVELS
jgi:hypothetical protein